MRALLIVLALAAPASAESLIARTAEPTPAIRIGKPSFNARIEKLTVSLWVKDAEMVGTVGFDIAGADATQRDVTIPLALPVGARATAMEVEINGIRTHAFALQAGEARAFYQDTVRQMVDPALLEARGTDMALHVFPVAKQGKQHVDITLTLPRMRTLIVQPTGHAIGQLEVTAEGTTTITARATQLYGAKSIALPEAHRTLFEEVPARTYVTGTTSLVAGRANLTSNRITVSIGTHSDRSTRWLDKVSIRSRIKLAKPRLTYCYERELLRDASLAGTVNVQFRILRSGVVEVNALTGTLTDETVRSCISGVFASLEYPETDTDMVVNYPLTYQAAVW